MYTVLSTSASRYMYSALTSLCGKLCVWGEWGVGGWREVELGVGNPRACHPLCKTLNYIYVASRTYVWHLHVYMYVYVALPLA